jgi:uncharacterized protein YabE (DUF348 family)/3D (Asp-Asp-Asp) domain-containing protein
VVGATRVRRLRIRQAKQATFVVAGVVMCAGLLSLAARKDVTLVVAGRPQAVTTTSSNVQELLESTGLPDGVQVEPPPGTTLADGMIVVVSPPPGVPDVALRTMVDPHDVGVWVVERSDEGSFGKAASESGETNVSADVVGHASIVSVEAVVTGKVHDVLTNASTVEELLSAMGIEPDADDRVVPSPSTPLLSGAQVRYLEVDVAVVSEEDQLPFEVHTRYTADLAPGTVIVTRPGVPGIVRRTVEVVRVNGSVRGREVLRAVTVREPVAQERLSGPYAMTDGTLTEPGTGRRTQSGIATWYDPPWSGATAAHPFLPFGTRVVVTDVATGRSVTVVVDDRGPFAPGRIIDLSPEAFERLAPLGRGVLDVRIDW